MRILERELDLMQREGRMRRGLNTERPARDLVWVKDERDRRMRFAVAMIERGPYTGKWYTQFGGRES